MCAPEMRGRAAISLYYFTLMAAVGAFYPYFALYLTSVGLRPATATRVLAIVPLVGLATPPLLGMLADARSARVWFLRVLTLGTALAFAGYQLAKGNVAAVVVVTILFGVLRSPLTALADATNFEHVRVHGGSYGAQRMWGTVGYLVAAFGGGALIEATSLESVVVTTTAMYLIAAGCAWRMPAPAITRRSGAMDAYRRMWRQPGLWLFLVTLVPAQMAAVVYDTTLAMYLTRLGYGGTFVGAALAIGVGAEIVLMARSGAILGRLGAERALTIALAIAAARWLAMAHVHDPIVLLCMQPLHAFTFGLFWVAATALARDYAGPDAVAAGQGLMAAVMGIGSVVGSSFAGDILERHGGAALWTCAAALAATATVGALLHARARAAAAASATATLPAA
jgi:MFS transporter, PPP family, 3-phenylpropionic acid transporter